MFNITNSYSKYLVAFVAFTFTLIPGVDFIVLKLRIEINYLPYLLLLLIITFFVGLIFVWKNQKTTSLNSIKKPKKKNHSTKETSTDQKKAKPSSSSIGEYIDYEDIE